MPDSNDKPNQNLLKAVVLSQGNNVLCLDITLWNESYPD